MVFGAGEAEPDIRVPAPRAQRLGAAVIDWVLWMVPLVPVFWCGIGILGASRRFGNSIAELAPLSQLMDVAAVVAVLALLALAVIQCVLATRGSSVGKRSLGLQVVTQSGRDAHLGFVRGVILRVLVPNLASSVTGGLSFLIDQAFIFRDDRRCLHDHIAGTMVLTNPRWQDIASEDAIPVVRP
jgi:uncharacterized RDD family membrane protein YckC